MPDNVDYQAVVADLKSRRARLDQLIAGFEAMILGQGDPATLDVDPTAPTGGVLPTMIHADTFFGLSIADAAKKFLKMARRAQHTAAIADAVGQGGLKRPDVNVMSSILVRAAKGREVTKVGKGMWGLAEWYPKSAKEPDERRKRPEARKARVPKASKKGAPEKKASPKAAAPAQANGTRPSDIAMEVIRGAAGKPLHATEIIKRISERGVVAARLPLEGFLNRQAKAGKLQKVGPSIFALAN
jgi:hypothetical protein